MLGLNACSTDDHGDNAAAKAEDTGQAETQRLQDFADGFSLPSRRWLGIEKGDKPAHFLSFEGRGPLFGATVRCDSGSDNSEGSMDSRVRDVMALNGWSQGNWNAHEPLKIQISARPEKIITWHGASAEGEDPPRWLDYRLAALTTGEARCALEGTRPDLREPATEDFIRLLRQASKRQVFAHAADF